MAFAIMFVYPESARSLWMEAAATLGAQMRRTLAEGNVFEFVSMQQELFFKMAEPESPQLVSVRRKVCGWSAEGVRRTQFGPMASRRMGRDHRATGEVVRMMGEDSAAKAAGPAKLAEATVTVEGDVAAAGAEDSPAEAGEETIDPRLDRIIGDGLQAHYDDILSAPLPDKFIMLLAELAAKEGSS